ncbi:MAG: hypothetical protein H6766_07290 [Candidatus Peribacteria bacterium]|nr:MAG: hypothetical protein H6766_07290 [Candidatus Peribacteria bacterium]
MSLFINLPVSNLPAATTFYTDIGFTQNMHFSDENASGLSFHDKFYVMLLSHDFVKTFLPEGKTIADSHHVTEVLNAIQLESKEAVDDFLSTVITAGGKEIKQYDHGFMYGHDFEDLDGHIWEIFWMDPTHIPTN